jgi:spermidine/putrescine transport system substrate-binding protein
MRVDWEKSLNEFLDRYRDRAISRRSLLRFIGLTGLSLGVVGGPWVREARADWTIRFDGWGGTTSAAFKKYCFDPFCELTTIKVIEKEIGDPDEYFEKVKKSFNAEGMPTGEYNIVHLSGLPEYARYVHHDFGLILEEKRIPNLTYVMPAMLDPYREITPEGLSGVPYDYGVTGIAYNTKHVSGEEAEKMGVGLLWNEKLKGKIGTDKNWKTNIWYAALHTGQNPNRIRNQKDVWAALAAQKPLIKSYWQTGAEQVNLLAKGVIAATPAWSGRIANLQAGGAPIGFFIPKDALAWHECMFAIRGSNKSAASIFINFLLAPETAIAVAQGQKYPPSLDPTKVPMPEAVQKLYAFDPTGKLENLTFADHGYWNGHADEWSAKWEEIRTGKTKKG